MALKPPVHGYLLSLACAICGIRAVPVFWNDIYSRDAWKSLIPRGWEGSTGTGEDGGKSAVL